MEHYETIIKPNRNWLYFDWRGLVHYRDLLFLLVRRDFVAKYKQTILGPAWFILQPLLTTLVFTVIFGNFAKIPTDSIPPVLFYLCGMTAWSYFAQCLTSISTSLTSNAALFSKVYFPRLVIPLSIIISNLFAYVLQLGTFLAFYFYFKCFTAAGSQIALTNAVFVLPFLVFQTALISLGVGLWIAALTVRYRDFQHLVAFLAQIWLYATPVIYPMSAVPEKWRFISLINPMTPIVELYRRAFFGVSGLGWNFLFISFAVSLVLLISGLLIFNRTERTFVDLL